MTITLRGTLPDLARYRLRRAAIRWALSRATGILSVSASLRADAVALGVAPEKVAVVPNGVDTERFRPRCRARARQQLGLPADRPTVLTVGALREVKGHHVLLEALAIVRQRCPQVLAVFVGGRCGSDDRRGDLQRQTADLGLQANVRWAGARPHEDIPRWLAAADVFALASRREGCCNAVLEALACGRPVVATNVGGNPEIVNQECLGQLVPPADPASLAAALEAALRRRWSSDRIRRAVEPRSWDTVARRVVEHWQDLLADRRPGTAPLSGLAPSSGIAARELEGSSATAIDKRAAMMVNERGYR